MWVKSSKSSTNGSCVEIKGDGKGGVMVRDSKLGDKSPILTFVDHEWDAFVAGIREGELTSDQL